MTWPFKNDLEWPMSESQFHDTNLRDMWWRPEWIENLPKICIEPPWPFKNYLEISDVKGTS
jgi:hypothetical protein